MIRIEITSRNRYNERKNKSLVITMQLKNINGGKMNRFFSKLIQEIEPYVPGEQPKDKKYIKLNTNENPYPPSPKVLEAIQKVDSELKLYPDPECSALRETAAQYYGLKKEQVFVGNGSDEVLAFCFPAFFLDKPLYFPDITYSFYPVYSKLFGVEYENKSLKEDFIIHIEDYFDNNGSILIPNPNAPTGEYLGLNSVKEILKNNPDNLVVMDEAYVDFGGESCVKLIDEYPNLLVIQTLSKSWSLAGLRVGFALGNEELIDGLNRVKNSFNSYTLDVLAQVGAKAALEDIGYFNEIKNKIMNTRDGSVKALSKLGFKVLDSKANFIFVSHKTIDAKDIFEKLKEKGVLVRYFNKPRINQYLRISVGTDEEMEKLCEALKKIINI